MIVRELVGEADAIVRILTSIVINTKWRMAAIVIVSAFCILNSAFCISELRSSGFDIHGDIAPLLLLESHDAQ